MQVVARNGPAWPQCPSCGTAGRIIRPGPTVRAGVPGTSRPGRDVTMNALLEFPVWVGVRIDRLKTVGFLEALLLIDSGNRSDILPVFTDLALAERYLTERGRSDAVLAAVRT